jgi:threonine/homoserine/homoserine lactone efflux protein
MSLDAYIPLWLFIILMVSTPGPANLLIMSAGAQRGFWPCMPFNAGLITGKLALNILMILGLGALIIAYPIAAKLFAYLSALYMTWIALKGWNAHQSGEQRILKLRFRDGVPIHPLSPKAWLMSSLAVTQFGSQFSGIAEQLLVIPVSFVLAELVFHSAWCLLGALMHKAIGSNAWLNRSLIILTIAVVVWALTH